MTEIEKLAREMALADINKRRATQRLPRGAPRAGPLLAVPDFYWRDFGAEWLAKAKAAQELICNQ